ncbi:C6 finger domain [Cordyceps militaris]|uniref:C6 finger domain n=1 Tax=Cordyceps militaris TaxID=73501 RepID=A0A2H4SC71_CORMI|nr:C6 finger domain [Cordyceps militaris]
MAPDNPVGGDGDAGTVTNSTAPASSNLATGPSPSPPPSAAAVATSAAPEPQTSTPPASRPPPTSSNPEPAASTSSTSTSTSTALATASTVATTAAAAAATIASPATITPTTIPHAPAPAAEAASRSPLNDTRAAQPSPAPTDGEMSNHLLLLGRQAAAPPASHPSPSSHHSASYRTDTQPQAPTAPSTATSAPPPSTNPTTQFTSYPNVTTSQAPDAQRAAGHANGPNAVTLPSMRTIDAMTQQQPQSGPHPHTINGPLQPASPSGQAYYAQSTVGATPGYGLHTELSRYPLPHDPRLPGSRGSKKCDEAHPTCNNCKKSKRECLGYDPIFRQQPAAQPGSIQPAPSPTASLPSSNSPGSVAGNGRQINAYTTQSSMLPASYAATSTPHTATANPTPNTAYHSISVAAAHSATSIAADTRYEYSASANPASRAYQPAAAFDPARHVNHTANNQLDHRLPEPGEHNYYHTMFLTKRLTPIKAPKMKVHQIIDSLGPTPTSPQVPASEETFSEITKVYHEMYATALAAFFETTWYYFAENNIMSFPKHPPLLEQMASFLKVLEAVKANDHTQMAYSGILETRIVWQLACTAFQTPERGNASMRVNLPPEGDSAEARSRLQVVDTLLCGEYLPNNPLSPPVADSDTQRTRQFDFWYNLADFIRHRDNPESPQAQQAQEDVLGRMRGLLDGRENRDVLYSIAVVRHLSPRLGPNYGTSQSPGNDEAEPKSRLAVASGFLLNQSQVTGGTTNVVRRISDIACRAFVNPGVNIARRA